MLILRGDCHLNWVYSLLKFNLLSIPMREFLDYLKHNSPRKMCMMPSLVSQIKHGKKETNLFCFLAASLHS